MPETLKRGRGRPRKGNVIVSHSSAALREGSEKSNQIKDLQDFGAPLACHSTDTQDADLARETLRMVCRDTTAPPAARAQAARTLAEMAHALGRTAPPPPDAGKPLSSMSRAELEAELAALSGG